MKHDAFLTGEKIYLRPFRSGDEQMIARIENHPDPRRTLFYALPTTPGQQQEKLSRLLNDPSTIILIMCRNSDDLAIGQTAFFRIDWISRAAVFYIAIAEAENWSKGYGSEATRLMVNYAFQTLNLNRIQLHVAIENEAGVKSYQRAGFIIEGTLRQAMFHQGLYCDFYVMGILRQDWLKDQLAEINHD